MYKTGGVVYQFQNSAHKSAQACNWSWFIYSWFRFFVYSVCIVFFFSYIIDNSLPRPHCALCWERDMNPKDTYTRVLLPGALIYTSCTEYLRPTYNIGCWVENNTIAYIRRRRIFRRVYIITPKRLIEYILYTYDRYIGITPPLIDTKKTVFFSYV